MGSRLMWNVETVGIDNRGQCRILGPGVDLRHGADEI